MVVYKTIPLNDNDSVMSIKAHMVFRRKLMKINDWLYEKIKYEWWRREEWTQTVTSQHNYTDETHVIFSAISLRIAAWMRSTHHFRCASEDSTELRGNKEIYDGFPTHRSWPTAMAQIWVTESATTTKKKYIVTRFFCIGHSIPIMVFVRVSMCFFACSLGRWWPSAGGCVCAPGAQLINHWKIENP